MADCLENWSRVDNGMPVMDRFSSDILSRRIVFYKWGVIPKKSPMKATNSHSTMANAPKEVLQEAQFGTDTDTTTVTVISPA